MSARMKAFKPMIALAIAAIALPLAAQGQIGTIARGDYACELPGDAAGAAGIRQPDADFTIESASRYTSAQGSGTYLRRGDRVTMTSGPRNGEEFQITARDFLRRIENGVPGRLRCLRQRR